MSERKPIRVLLVDDSATVRLVLREILESDPEIQVMAAAADPIIAARYMREEKPDVIVLDIEMPRMDGLTFLDRIMTQHPIPVVMCSSLTDHGSEATMEAFARGAVEVICKPQSGVAEFLEEARIAICETVRAAAKVDPHHIKRTLRSRPHDHAVPKKSLTTLETTATVIVIGASTGGTEALPRVLEGLPETTPGIVIVQHMPEKFTERFAQRLDRCCKLRVKEAEHGDSVLRGHALVAPGGKHVILRRSGARYYVDVKDGPLVSRHRPSVDVLFRSTARAAGRNTIAVILTGMGNDGADGMRALKEAGARTIAQDEASCVVFGMPREAIQKGAVDRVLPLEQISSEILAEAGA